MTTAIPTHGEGKRCTSHLNLTITLADAWRREAKGLPLVDMTRKPLPLARPAICRLRPEGARAVSNLPPINDHDFMRIVRKLVNATPPTPMTRIAFDLGVDVDDLCSWIMRYREPKRKAYISRDGAPIAPMTSADRQRLANHARAAEAAAEARRSIAIVPRSERSMAERAEAE